VWLATKSRSSWDVRRLLGAVAEERD
jgi:hypothetical protein